MIKEMHDKPQISACHIINVVNATNRAMTIGFITLPVAIQ